jgi:hypothetical protein
MPTYVVIEQNQSRQYNYESGRITATRVFKVYDSTNTSGALASGLQQPSDINALFGTATTPDALPQKGDAFPGETGVFARSFSLAREPGADIWTVTWSYSNNGGGSGLQPSEPGYVEWTLDVQSQFAETWMLPSSYPTNGSPGATLSEQKILGTQLDIEGEPVSRLRYTTEIQISETISNSSGLPAIAANMRAYRGSRNSGVWEGAAAGKVLYTGGSIRRTGLATYVATHRLVEDSEFHLIQYPGRDSTGKIPTAVTNGANRAKDVYWRQPFPSLLDFTAISTNW